jgi:hypothetical protein
MAKVIHIDDKVQENLDRLRNEWSEEKEDIIPYNKVIRKLLKKAKLWE